MTQEFSPEESELLIGLLEHELEEIRTEIHHSQSHEYKESLKKREALVQELVGRLKG